MKFLLLSDTHGEREQTMKVIEQYPDMDYYFHMGDLGIAKQLLPQFIFVKGNHDFDDTPKQALYTLEQHQILILHGDHFDALAMKQFMDRSVTDFSWDDCLAVIYQSIATYAKEKGCDVVFFGHTHTAVDTCIEGIRLINPGSLCFSHDGRPPSYALVDMNKQDMKVHFVFLDK